jgi:hypothetical protein
MLISICGKPDGDIGEKMVILYKFNANGKKELFSMDYETLSMLMNGNAYNG